MLKTKDLNFKNFIFYNDIHIMKGQINFLTGESGCGKSTLLKLFNRTENFSAGEILYKDSPITTMDTLDLRKEIKLISQTPFLFSGTIKDNFERFYDYCSYEALTTDQMNYFLNLTEAHFPLDMLCERLSGGEKQRVYIAICLSMKAEMIMLDEPTAALNSTLSIKVLTNIVAFVKKHHLTLLVVSHDQVLTEMFAEHVIHLSGGKINA